MHLSHTPHPLLVTRTPSTACHTRTPSTACHTHTIHCLSHTHHPLLVTHTPSTACHTHPIHCLSHTHHPLLVTHTPHPLLVTHTPATACHTHAPSTACHTRPIHCLSHTPHPLLVTHTYTSVGSALDWQVAEVTLHILVPVARNKSKCIHVVIPYPSREYSYRGTYVHRLLTLNCPGIVLKVPKPCCDCIDPTPRDDLLRPLHHSDRMQLLRGALVIRLELRSLSLFLTTKGELCGRNVTSSIGIFQGMAWSALLYWERLWSEEQQCGVRNSSVE